jgi:hypothetical protein
MAPTRESITIHCARPPSCGEWSARGVAADLTRNRDGGAVRGRVELDERARARDRIASDRDRRSSGRDRMSSDHDQIASDHDQACSDRDQQRSDEDQAAADRALEQGSDRETYERSTRARARSTCDREARSRRREEAALARAATAGDRAHTTAVRDLGVGERYAADRPLDARGSSR